jgi:hypothetical protein
VTRPRGFFFDVFPQACDEVVDRARIGILTQIPHVFEHLLPRDRFPLVLHQITQQIGFHQRQGIPLWPDLQLLGIEVDDLVRRSGYVARAGPAAVRVGGFAPRAATCHAWRRSSALMRAIRIESSNGFGR